MEKLNFDFKKEQEEESYRYEADSLVSAFPEFPHSVINTSLRSTYKQSPCTNEETESCSCTYGNSHPGFTYGLDSLNHLGLIPNRFMSWDQMVKI